MKYTAALPWDEIAILVLAHLDRTNLPMRQFAEIIGEDETAVNKWFRKARGNGPCREPGHDKIIKIAEWYDFQTREKERVESAMKEEWRKSLAEEQWQPMKPLLLGEN